MCEVAANASTTRYRVPGRPGRACVEEHVSVAVAPHEVGARDDVENARPAMGVHRHRLPGPDARVEDPDLLVLEEQAVVLRRRDQRVE